MTKLKEYLLQEQTTQELRGAWSSLNKVTDKISSAANDVKSLRKITKAVAGRELKQLEDELNKINIVAKSAMNKIEVYRHKVKE